MRVASFTKYTRLGASSRLRTLQYIPSLNSMGIDVDVFALFDDAYVNSISDGGRSISAVLRHYLRRAGQLRRLGGYDLLWVEYELLPWIPWLIERQLLPRSIPLVVDYDDAVFHRYDQHRSGLVRHALGNKIDRIMARASTVIAGNQYLADRARAAGASAVEIVPTVVDTERYCITDYERTTREPCIGWIGSPSTARYLARLEPVVEAARASRDVAFVAVGAPANSCPPGFKTELWSEQSEVDQIRRFTIGVMPLDDSPWERGKCGYKLIQYMACGVPVVASPVSANKDIVRHGVDGFFATTDEEWKVAVGRLLQDPGLRRNMGTAGRQRVVERYSLESQAPRVLEILRSAAHRTD